MKLGMKFTFALFAAFLIGLLCGGAWLRWVSLREAREAARADTVQLLDALAQGLAKPVEAGDPAAAERLAELAARAMPGPARVEVVDGRGTRLAAVGPVPPEGIPLEGLYKPVLRPDGTVGGGVQVLIDLAGLERAAAESARPGGTALFAAMCVAWILAEVAAALLVFSPLKKLHRALEKAARRSGPVDTGWLREETRTRGDDEIGMIAENACALIERRGEADTGGAKLTVLEGRGPTNREA